MAPPAPLLATSSAESGSSQHRQLSSSSGASFGSNCVVCMAEPPNTLLPCGHSVLCTSCADGILAAPSPLCPLCRVRVVDFQVLPPDSVPSAAATLLTAKHHNNNNNNNHHSKHRRSAYSCLLYHKDPSPEAQLAKKQYIEAMNMVFDSYENMYDNAPEALGLFLQSAHYGFPFSQMMMALMLKNGIGCEVNETASVKWLKKAAEQNLGMAMVLLGRWYGATGKVSKMIKYYKKAVLTGRAAASAAYGYCLYTGYGIPQDFVAAREFLTAASSTGYHPKCYYYLGVISFCGLAEESPNLTEAFRLFQLAAKEGDATAQHWVSRCHRLGFGTAKNKELALEWLTKAANGNHSASQNELGCRWMSGDGVTKDVEVGLEWIKKAAAKKNVCATFVLAAYCERHGQEEVSTAEDAPPSFTHKSLAKEYQNRARKMLAKPKYKLQMAESLEFGEGCDADVDAALRWYTEAAGHNSPYAGFALKRLRGGFVPPVEMSVKKAKSKKNPRIEDEQTN